MRKQIWVYCIAEFLYTLSHAMVATTYILFLKKTIGLTQLEIGLVNIGFILAHVIFTVPTGIIADRIGRKTSYLIACIIGGISVTCYYFADSFWDAMAVEALGGLGLAFYDGALTALVIDKIKKVDGNVNKVLSISRLVNIAAFTFGGSLGAFIGSGNIGYPFLACGVFSLICTVFTVIFIKEEKREAGQKSQRPNCGLVRESIRHIKDVASHRILFPLAMISFSVMFISEIFTKMWTLHLEPLVKSQAVFSPIWVVMMAGSVIGAAISYRAKEKNFPIMIVGFRVATGVSLALCALYGGLGGKVFFIAVLELALAGARTVSDTEVNSYVESHHRAAVLSAYGMIGSLGAILGLLGGSMADRFSITTTWIWGGIVTSIISTIFGYIYLRNKQTSP